MTPKNVKWRELRHHWEIYLFVLPTLLLVALFQYYPAASGVFHSFFRWNGADIAEPVGAQNYLDLLASSDFWNSFEVAFILGAWNIVKMIPPLLVAVCIHRCRSEKAQFFYRCMFVIPMVMPTLVIALVWRSFFFEASAGYLNQFLYSTGLYDVLCWLDEVFQWGSVVEGQYQGIFVKGIPPNWLGDPKLILGACIIWGFPWVGSFAVLTHLAKLQNISKDIYEAADIDGVSWWTRFTKIEFPLITSSIYLLLVLTVIETIKDAATILALTDMNGGPGGVVAVPALFMLRKAFVDNQMGSACAIGIVLTMIVMTLQKLSVILLKWGELSKRQRLAARAGMIALALLLIYSNRFIVLAAGLLLIAIPFSSIAGFFRGLWPQNEMSSKNAGAMWDQRLSRRLARQQQPLNLAVERIKEYGLRFSKHLVICAVLATALLPVYLMAIVSIKTNQQFYEAPAVLTAPAHFENWSTAWELIRPSLANSLYLSISTTFLALSFALAGAYFFARLHVPLSSVLWNAILVLMMMPTVANLIPLFGLLRDMNLINTLSALILVGTASGQVFSIFVLRNFVSDIPQDLFEAADIDGASHFQQLKTIVLPLSGTILGTIGVMLFIQQWNEFVLPLIVMRDEIRLPVMVQLQRLDGSYVKQFGPLMAGFALASIPVIVLFIFSMKLFIKGMTEGAVKG